MQSVETPHDENLPYAGLTPDVVLNALDSAGLITTGSLLALNSYENRVFQVGVEQDGGTGFEVAKFYRPGRWTDAAICFAPPVLVATSWRMSSANPDVVPTPSLVDVRWSVMRDGASRPVRASASTRCSSRARTNPSASVSSP